MLFITTAFQQPDTELYLDVLQEIDNKILQISKMVLNNARFAFENKVNYDAYEDLKIYRTILFEITYCATWLCDINAQTVVSKIKNLLNSLC